MLLSFLLIIYFVRSISLKDELGVLYLTEGESYKLYLSDYFSGNGISFSIDSSQKLATIKSTCDFNLSTFSPFKNPEWNSTWSYTNPERMILPINSQSQLIIWCNRNFLALYSFSFTNKTLSFIWAESINTLYQNPVIQNVVYFNQARPFLLIQVKQEENINDDKITRNDFYYMSISNLTNLKSPLWANFSDVAYASKLVIGNGDISRNFPVYCEFDYANILYIYNVNSPFIPVLTQKITKYYGPQYPFTQLSIISIILVDNQLYILDENIGLVIYEQNLFFREEYWVNLGNFNPFYSLEYIDRLKFAVLADQGLILFHIEWSEEPWVIGITKSEGLFDWANGYIQPCGDYYFIQSNSGILSIIPNWWNPLDILYNVNLAALVGERFENNGLSGFFFDSLNKIHYYARFDSDGLRIYEASLEEWSLEVLGNSTFSAIITGKDELDSSVSSSLEVISIPSNSQQILPLDNFREADILPIEFFNTSLKASDISLLQNSFFSGPNLSFKMEPLNSKYFSFKFSTEEKILFLQRLSVPNNVTKVFIYDTVLLYFYLNAVEAFINFPESQGLFNISNPLLISTSSTEFITFYSQPQENSYLISTYQKWNFPINIILLQEIESEIECIFLLSSNWNLICSNRRQIGLYVDKNEQYEFVKHLAGEMFDGGSPWNLTDIAISDNQIGSFFYLIDENNGFFVFSIVRIFYQQPPFYYDYFIPKTRKIIKIITSNNFIGLVNEDGWIELYRYPFTYFKTIFTSLNFSDFVDSYAMMNMIYIQINNTIFVYDSNEPFHNWLYSEFTVRVPGVISYYTESLLIANFYLNNSQKYLEIYQSACPNIGYENIELIRCSLDMEIEILINDITNLTEIAYSQNIAITAYNEFFSLTENFPVSIFINGKFLWMKDEEWKIKRNIPYNERYEVDLSDLFFGQAIAMNLNINGNLIVNSTQSNLPCFIPERVTQIGYYEPTNGTNFYSHIIIPHTNISIILSDAGFEIINALEFTQKGILINITNIQYQNLHCNSMDSFSHAKNDRVLLITSCSYQVIETIFYTNITLSEPKFINALVLWEINYHSFKISQQKLFNITTQPGFLRVAALDENNFEIITLSDDWLSSKNKYMLRFRGSWRENTISVQQVETINFYILGLNFFNPLLADFKVKNSEIMYWYVLDASYGVRIIETRNSGPSLLVGGISASMINSIGICKDQLLFSATSEVMFTYKIKEFVHLEQSLTYNPASTAIMTYFFSPCLIQCSINNRYIASNLFNNFRDTFVGVWDMNAAQSSSFLSAIYISSDENYGYSDSFKFIDDNTISTVGGQENAYKSFKLNEKRIVFPKMNHEKYNDLVKSWGTKEFSLYIIAGNGNNELSSQMINFTRENSSNHSKSYWWIWIVMAIVIIGIAIGGFYFLKKRLKAQKRRSLELIFMKKYEHEMGEDIEFEESKS